MLSMKIRLLGCRSSLVLWIASLQKLDPKDCCCRSGVTVISEGTKIRFEEIAHKRPSMRSGATVGEDKAFYYDDETTQKLNDLPGSSSL